MEKVYDLHIHYSFDIPLRETKRLLSTCKKKSAYADEDLQYIWTTLLGK